MQLKKEKRYYVVCPSNATTGGPDALHQMVYYMVKQGFNCKIAYLADTINGLEIPEPYRIYINDMYLFKNVKDVEENNVIIPESLSFLSHKFKKANVYIWWLSVDNNLVDFSWYKRVFYLFTSPLRILKHKQLYKCSVFTKIINTMLCREYSFNNERENVIHLCASYYALDIIGRKTQKKVNKCIEPISYIFLDKYKKEIIECIRNDTILYNPKKSGLIVEKLKQRYPSYEFKPLVNMTQQQLIEAYKKAKLYIDFGPFPGAERIPKEAVLYGCTIITGRRGASNYHGDVPIPDKYKFMNDNDLENIASMINFCLKNYDLCYPDFDEYRSTVLALESNFEKAINTIFNSKVISDVK